MPRSTAESWRSHGGDLKEEEVHDVPVKGESVLIRALPASFSAKLLEKIQVGNEGRQEIGEVAASKIQILQFKEGVVDPELSEEDVRWIADHYGPAFHKVMERINAISGVDEGAIEQTADRFPVGGNGSDGPRRGELGADAEVAAGPGGRPDLGV